MTDESIKEDEERLANQADDPNHLDLVGKNDDGEIVALAHIFRDEAGKSHLGALYVDKSAQGSGLAQGLMNEAIKFAGDEPLYTAVATYNSRARRFYEKMGFAEIPNSEHLFADKIPEIDLVRAPHPDNS